jgi:putative spermidine/putrescine transport system substrate-binding protein
MIGLPKIFAQEVTATPEPELPPAPAAGPIDLEAAGGIDKLIEAAKAEGQLSVIALPDDWANYGQMKKDFLAKYDFLTLNDISPDAGSGDEIGAIKTNAGNTGPSNPDVIDVGFIWGKTSRDQGLLQPYKVATWDTIPDSIKDEDGYWYGDYYGTMAFEVNADIVENVPQDWADLLKPEYAGMIGLAGDPTKASQAIHSIWGAALANGGSLDDPQPGLDFFKQLVDAGNFVPVIADVGKLVKGETPIVLRWDYNALADRDNNPDTNIQVVYPKSGTIAGVYLQAINAYSPQPNAARLWMEFLYSDEGQLIWLKGYAKPASFDDMMKRKVIPDDLLAKLPVVDVPVAFPTADQINTALAAIKDGWVKTVGVAVAAPG